MTAERAKEIFFAATEQSDTEREAYLKDACGGDSELRSMVDGLLESHDAAGAFLAAPTAHDDWGDDHAAALRPDVVQAGHEIGPYRIVRLLGAGGFGSVYLAEQLRPVERLVAIKVLRAGHDSAQIVARFGLERRALARMSHAAIARVFDAGVDPNGRPWVAMEYIDGQPLTEFADQKRLTLDARLKLFEQTCRAVHHAHQKGIIHRDLKPTNILVTEVDGLPVPKIIDFGIAKAIADSDEDTTRITDGRQLIGTAEYMAPEQAALATDRHDTRTDVYALGVLLYELLCGVTPFDGEELRKVPLPELQRILLEDEPAAMTRRFVALGADAHDIARARQADPSRLRRDLHGELSWIVTRALSKDPDRRYPSAHSFAADVRRFLDQQPVEAGPVSRRYRLGKFVRRHRIELASAVVASSALIALVVISMISAAQADVARGEAEEKARSFEALANFSASILAGVSPETALGADTELLRRILTDATQRVDGDLGELPEAEVSVRLMIGNTLMSLAEWEPAEEQIELAINRARAAFGEGDVITLQAEDAGITLLMQRGRFDEARPRLERIVEWRETKGLMDTRVGMESRSNLAYLDLQAGDFASARDRWADVLVGLEAEYGADHRETMATRNNLAAALGRMREFDRAIELYRLVLAHQEKTLTEAHPKTLATMSNLANALTDSGASGEAEELMVRSLEIKRRILPAGHPSIIVGQSNLAAYLSSEGRADEAEALFLEALANARETYDADDIRLVIVMNNLAGHYRRTDRLDEARDLLVQCDETMSRLLPANHPNHLMLLGNLALVEEKLGRVEDGEAHARVAFDGWTQRGDNDHPRRGAAALIVGRIRLAAGDTATAAEFLREAQRILELADQPAAADAAELLSEIP